MYVFFVNIFSWYRVNLSNKLKTLFICGSFQKYFKWFLVVNLELCGTKFAKHRHQKFPFFICCSCKSSKTHYRQTLLILLFAEQKKLLICERSKMPSLLDSLESLFETRDLYEVLGTKKEASEAQIRKAYHKVKITDSILLILICYLLDLCWIKTIIIVRLDLKENYF